MRKILPSLATSQIDVSKQSTNATKGISRVVQQAGTHNTYKEGGRSQSLERLNLPASQCQPA